MGLGSGATPMVSIIKDVINNLQNIERDEEQGGQTPTFSNQKTIRISASPSTPNNTKKKNNNSFKTRRAYFYWSTSKQSTYDWFRGIMNEVAEKDKDGIVELHNYCTSVHKEGDARSAVITMLQTLYHAKNGVDVVSGTRVKCHFARPNWRKVFDNVANHHPDTRVGKPIHLHSPSNMNTFFGGHKKVGLMFMKLRRCVLLRSGSSGKRHKKSGIGNLAQDINQI